MRKSPAVIEAARLGKEAYGNDEDVDQNNPYDADTDEHRAWAEAFLDAERNDPLNISPDDDTDDDKDW